ncbi:MULTISPECIES: class I SAM-dependent methyltransferase [unclassified Sphingobium]|uniref:class I SAM-dependent methyltransferase n=1 Tax=unclassified Sphingobium TaxID=2611147 RepID=UPI000D177AE0|nr:MULTISPECIES: class I SAM-dependent methyltransferase [unclassified Sphingobium]MBG6119685.1 SAM-dependent methyltransferase [Sphingobium sp. JAI105]PSO13236.1 SAM-dependent methyltransferase [Sphingobium sp. AEW4]TWD11463.1 methyltransferase family protein [Sphingobium sp. AEW010]TWD28646.1 methyltransferase family protein [Sphingobium sp. AEW013]TWD30005.1 methyltransferase family protein [Sphingobium sp. AEW001]
MTETCRFCATKLTTTVADLGLTPVSNELRNIRDAAGRGQTFYPLKAMVCEACWLVQLTRVETPAHFTEDYVYFSSFSESWLRHARDYAHAMIAAQALNGDSLVVELASNDGYLLQYFKQAGIPVLGIDPTANTARAAKEKHGIETVVDFFGVSLAARLASQGIAADLIAANNVLAHVPDPKDFIGGIPAILKPGGTFTIEFPHILRMLESCQFDTIYHEHFSYLSLLTVERMLGAYGLEVYGVEELPTHGGSLRVYASHEGAGLGSVELAVGLDRVRLAEKRAGLDSAATYRGFANEVEQRKIELLDFLIKTKRAGKKVLGYGAPAKGSTMLNYCGVGPELLPFTVDRSPHKQGHYLPGVNIPILAPEELIEARPDYVLILPWNLRDEIAAQLCQLRDWGGRFVVAIPRIEIF